MVLGGTFSSLGPFGEGLCTWSMLTPLSVGNGKDSESIGPEFRSGKVEVGRP